MTATVPVSPRSLLASLPDAAREELLLELLAELTAGRSATAAIPLVSAAGTRHGYYVPQLAADLDARFLPPMTDADRARGTAAMADLANTFRITDYLTELDRADGIAC